MRHTDIAIVGGGLAGSLAAAMLGRAGYDAVLVDPHPVYPPDFRCEKLDGPQVRLLEKTGLAEPVLHAATHDGEVWIARFGRLVERRPSDQQGILYDTLVNTVRAEIPHRVDVLTGKASAVATSPDRQQVTLSDGTKISARLVVMANGLNSALRYHLGMGREELSKAHSISIGFDMAPVGDSNFPFRAMTYYGEHCAARAAYITLFPIGATMRANLFVYRDFRDPWLSQMRHAPRDALRTIMPRLERLTGDFAVIGPVQIRPVDLYVTTGWRQPGVVLVGDAFATSCPAAGTGLRKVFTDVERLCNVHLPAWLASPGMDEDKITAFYDDPVKQACDAFCADKAWSVRALAIDPGLPWLVRRWGRFVMRAGSGLLRNARSRVSGRAGAPAAIDRGLGTPA
jgi:2-polyprenyl-6-methoxyphenol hydroxylase-like FAD-dependent oxidoreductase